MKKVLSLFLCFVMCISLFCGALTPVYAVGSADKIFTVKDGAVKNKILTYTINMASGLEGIGGATLLVEFDSSVLMPVNCELAWNSSNVLYTHGLVENEDGLYAISYINSAPQKTSTSTPFFTMRFEVVDDNRPTTEVTFYCKEYYSTTDSDQNITVGDGLQLVKRFTDVSTLEPPALKGAQLGTGYITLSWEKADGANGYIIRRQSDDSGRDVVAEVNADVFEYIDSNNLESGKTYTYFVQSVKGDLISLYDSNGVSCKYVAKPQLTYVKNAVGGVEISWNATAGADSYVIMRREVNSDETKTEWIKLVTRLASSSTVYKDVSVENGKTYEYDVNSVVGSFMTDTAENGEMVSYLESPTISSIVNTDGGIELTWKALDNASYYEIYRKAIGVDTDFVYYDTVATNSFTDLDGNVVAGKTYTYTVKAVNDYGESAFTKTGYTITRVPSTIVTNMVLGSDNITVFWEEVSGVSGYKIYRKTESSSWVEVGSVKTGTLFYKDASVVSGNEYYYSAVPYIGKYESAKNSSVEKIYYISAPVVSVDNVKNGIEVFWDTVFDADSYKLFKKKMGENEFSLVKELSSYEELKYLDSDVQENSVYYYAVQAISDKGESKKSDSLGGVMRIECVKGLEITKITDGVQLNWKSHRSADKYIVCRKEGAEWKEITTVSENSYVDKSVVSGNTYAYAIKPVVGDYVGGIDKAAVEEFEFLAAPTLTVTNKASSAVVTWNGVTGAEKYLLYRATVSSSGKVSSYKKIADVSYKTKQYIDEDVTAGGIYRYVIYTVDGSVKSVASKTYVNVFLGIPTITKFANAYSGTKLTWSAVKGAKNYIVYRKFSGESKWTILGTVASSSTSFVDKGAKNGVKATYTVRAKNGTSMSAYTSKNFTFLQAPKITLKNTGSAINVSWNKVAGAKSYYLYRMDPGTTSWKRVGIITKTSYTDKNVKPGKTYKYTVRTYNGSAFSGYNTSGWSIKRLTAPKLTGVKNNAGNITVTWGKVSGASTYNVYRKLKGEDTWTKIATNVKATSFTDKNVKNGKTYIYTVKAYSGSSSSSYYSGIEIKRLARPELVSAKSSKSGITVVWEATSGASGYYVYRKTGNGSWSRIAKVSGNGTVKYLDKTAKKGVTYTYTVRAYSGSSASSFYSAGLKCKDKY